MFELNRIVRPGMKDLKPYSSARNEYTGSEGVFLDANENPFGNLNRYPDPLQTELKIMLSKQRNIPTENIFIGNGSDEAIDLCLRIFCTPSKDKMLTFSPTYGMYQVSASINDVEMIEMPLDEDFQIPIESIFEIVKTPSLKLIFVCSPNNPTGNVMQKVAIEKMLNEFNGIVVVDEAYIDFCDTVSWKDKVAQFPNLIVLQTLSKAWGLANARIGMAFADKSIIELFNRIKPPYNVSGLNQKEAVSALLNPLFTEKNIETIKKGRQILINELEKLEIVERIFPSDTNFILVKFRDANATYRWLKAQKIIVRNRHQQINNCLRITVGTPEENTRLINALQHE